MHIAHGFVYYIATALYKGIGSNVGVRAWLRVLFRFRVLGYRLGYWLECVLGLVAS